MSTANTEMGIMILNEELPMGVKIIDVDDEYHMIKYGMESFFVLNKAYLDDGVIMVEGSFAYHDGPVENQVLIQALETRWKLSDLISRLSISEYPLSPPAPFIPECLRPTSDLMR